MIRLDSKQGKWDTRTREPSMETIDISLRYLQILLTKISNETGYIAENGYNDQYMDNDEINVKAFSDEGSCTIKGIQHMINKATIHAEHTFDNIKTMRGERQLHSTYSSVEKDELPQTSGIGESGTPKPKEIKNDL